MRAYQQDLLLSEEENKKNAEAYAKGLALPVNPLQLKHSDEEPTLTEIEFEIMQMVLKGLEIHDIALKICRTVAGTKWRLSNIYFKFGVSNRLQLINKSSEKGLQFRTSSGIQHSFHNHVNMRAHELAIKELNDSK